MTTPVNEPLNSSVTAPGTSTDWSLYLVTDPALGGGRDEVASIARAAVDGGVSVVQLRDKELDDASFTLRAQELVAALDGTDTRIFLNDRVDIAARLGLHLHIGQDDMDYPEARRLLPNSSMIGLSVDSHAQIDRIAELIQDGVRPPDVLGLGPVELTATKTDTGRALGVTGPGSTADLASRASSLDIPSVAIGHVTTANAAALGRTDLVGICVVSAIMAAGSPSAASQNAHDLRSLFTSAKEQR